MTEFPKYPKIFYLESKHSEGFISEDAAENTIYIEEKMDGANFRFGQVHGTFRVGSRNVDLTQYVKINQKYPPFSDVDREKTGQFRNAILHALEYYTEVRPNYVYYVEYMIPHTIDYYWSRMPTFIGLDILDLDTGKFLSWKEKKKEFMRLGIPLAPLVWKGKLKDFNAKVWEEQIPKSAYRDGKAEGIVIKDYKRQWFVKIVAPEFREVNKTVWGIGSKKAAKRHSKDDSEWFVNAFVTKRRIEKIIEQLIAEGKPEGMELMQWLPKKVLLDAWEENWMDVALENVVIDTKRIRKLTADRCREVLRRWLTRRQLEKLQPTQKTEDTPNEHPN